MQRSKSLPVNFHKLALERDEKTISIPLGAINAPGSNQTVITGSITPHEAQGDAGSSKKQAHQNLNILEKPKDNDQEKRNNQNKSRKTEGGLHSSNISEKIGEGASNTASVPLPDLSGSTSHTTKQHTIKDDEQKIDECDQIFENEYNVSHVSLTKPTNNADGHLLLCLEKTSHSSYSEHSASLLKENYPTVVALRHRVNGFKGVKIINDELISVEIQEEMTIDEEWDPERKAVFEKQFRDTKIYAVLDTVRLMAYIMPLAISVTKISSTRHWSITAIPFIIECLYMPIVIGKEIYPHIDFGEIKANIEEKGVSIICSAPKSMLDYITNKHDARKKTSRAGFHRVMSLIPSAVGVGFLANDWQSRGFNAITGFFSINVGLRFSWMANARIKWASFEHSLSRKQKDKTEDASGFSDLEDAFYDGETNTFIMLMQILMDTSLVPGNSQFLQHPAEMQKYSVVASELVYSIPTLLNLFYTMNRDRESVLNLPRLCRLGTVTFSLAVAFLVGTGKTELKDLQQPIAYTLRILNTILIISLNYFQLKEGASNLKTHLKALLTEKLKGNLKFGLYTMIDICRIMSIPFFLALAAAEEVDDNYYPITIVPITTELIYSTVGTAELGYNVLTSSIEEDKLYNIGRLLATATAIASLACLATDSGTKGEVSVIGFFLSITSLGVSAGLTSWHKPFSLSSSEKREELEPDNRELFEKHQKANPTRQTKRRDNRRHHVQEKTQSESEQGFLSRGLDYLCFWKTSEQRASNGTIPMTENIGLTASQTKEHYGSTSNNDEKIDLAKRNESSEERSLLASDARQIATNKDVKAVIAQGYLAERTSRVQTETDKTDDLSSANRDSDNKGVFTELFKLV